MADAVESDWLQPPALDPAVVRHAWRVTEPLHALIYFASEAHDRYAALGIAGRAGYFASRSAALGPVGPGPVVGTFYSFSPVLVAAALPDVWQQVTPDAVLAARLDAADAALTRALGDAVRGPEVAEAAELARRAAESATAYAEGRPLFAAHAALPWPEPPHLVLWHAQTLLREFRGDGHVSALLVAGLTGLDAVVLYAAAGKADAGFLRRSRGWTAGQWADAVTGLRARGLLDGVGPTLTDLGRAQRAWIESTTDRLAVPTYATLGAEGCARLAELTRPLSRAVVGAGLLNPDNALPRAR